MSRYTTGSAESFEQLYERYEFRLMGFFGRRLSAPSRSMATDLFQITWLKVHQARDRFDPAQKFSSWIFTIALNVLRDYGRELSSTLKTTSLNDREMEAPTPTLSALTAQELKDLEHEIQNLPIEWREVLLLSDWEGFASQEVAAMKGLSEANVRQILSRARKTIKASTYDPN